MTNLEFEKLKREFTASCCRGERDKMLSLSDDKERFASLTLQQAAVLIGIALYSTGLRRCELEEKQ